MGFGTYHGHLDTQDSPRPGFGSKPPPYSLIVYSALFRGGGTRMAHFVGTPEMESRNCPGGTPGTLNCHNSQLRSWIATRSKSKLYPSSRSFQRHVALPNRTSGRGRFPSFSGRESNCQFDSRPFFCP